jgi:hypothetical protein
MSRYLRDGYLYFPPITIGGATGNYVTQCPLVGCEEAEYEILSYSTTDTGSPMLLISGDQKFSQLVYDGSQQIGLLNGTDNGAQNVPAIAAAWSGASIPTPPVSEFFPITDSQNRIFVRVDCAGGKSLYVSLRYRIRPIRTVVAEVATVHHDREREHNLARAERAHEQLAAKTIQQRGEAVNI